MASAGLLLVVVGLVLLFLVNYTIGLIVLIVGAALFAAALFTGRDRRLP